MKKKNEKKIIYHEPPMKYNVALHKFEPDLPKIKIEPSNVEINHLAILFILLLIIVIGIIAYLSR